MSDLIKKLIKFWSDFRNRKISRVIVTYSASAFIALQVVDITFPRLGLPDWAITMVIFILIAGFIASLIFFWIYDITPEGIKRTGSTKVDKMKGASVVSVNRKFKLSDGIIIVLLVFVCILLYPKIFMKDKFEKIREVDGRISIAVVPFENQTGDSEMDWFQRGISSMIINGLGGSSQLAVRDDNTMYEALESIDQVFTEGISPKQAKEVADKVNAETYIYGSCQGMEGKYQILANLVDTESGEIIWTSKVEGDLKGSEYLDLADSLCNGIKEFLELKALKEETDYDFREAYPESTESYRYFIEGMNYILTQDYESGIMLLKNALEIDSTFTFATFYLAYANGYYFEDEQRNIWTQNAYRLKQKLPIKYRQWLELWYACYISKDLPDIIRYCDLLAETDIESRLLWFDLGVTYYDFLQQYEKASNCFERVKNLSEKRGDDWEYEPYYEWYGKTLHKQDDHKKEKEIYQLGLEYYPDSQPIIMNLAICNFEQGREADGIEWLTKLKSILDQRGYSKANVMLLEGITYYSAGQFDKAEVLYRNARDLEPKNTYVIFYLCQLLVKNAININEGMQLVREGLEFEHDNPDFTVLNGICYYKMERLEEALKNLRKAEELNLSFDFDLHQQIMEVEQAIAEL